MPTFKQTIRKLAEYAIAKKGARQSPSQSNFDVHEFPSVQLPGGLWGMFFEIADEPYVRMPVLADRFKEHRKVYPALKKSAWEERDGHIYMEVSLHADLPVEFIKSLIDEAYSIVWNKLDKGARLKIELAGQPYDETKLLDRMIEIHDLKQFRKEIRKVSRPAILLRTTKSTEAKIPIAASKIGGQPDLPANVEWPVYTNGKPLAFLAQINLSEITKLGTPIKGLPIDGLLSIFSVWGWLEEGEFDPKTPTEVGAEQIGWTVILHTPKKVKLERRKTPKTVNFFKSAAVLPTPVLSLPNHRVEPPLAALGWTEELYDRFDVMQSDFRSLQMGYWLKNSDIFASHHQLGGYALFQQDFPQEVLEKGLAMLVQIGTDNYSKMVWGDGGELTFYADAKALAKGRFERVWGECQGG
ncbi:DUF1963 domain-containing protein [Telmatocola sphagniphila]|uniref:DUF1963 domain-containing protein n=1 Tax=Telmatocola sphagniphila TaxID=1123043 RepID=A0A8E6B587_9BACT|nr:DUF1963 domain-containing protein [Telmatocola sphagniphila]QVL31679.1 DUF1963 domain-containing protein [Telmatocola sphagniphila]